MYKQVLAVADEPALRSMSTEILSTASELCDKNT